MNKLEKLLARLNEIMAEMEVLGDKETLTDEEFTKLQGLDAEYETTEKEVEVLQKIEARKNTQSQAVNTPTYSQGGGQPAKTWDNVGEQLISVVKYAKGEASDDRLFVRGQAGLNEGVPSEGGFWVDKDWSTERLERLFEESPVLNMISMTSLTGNLNGLKLRGVKDDDRRRGARFGGIQTYWIGEGQTKTPSQPEFRKIELELKKLAGLCYLTDELLQDAGALASEVDEWFGEDMNFELVDAVVRGNGVGQPLGFLNSPALVSVPPEAGQAANTILYENIVNIYARMPARYRPNAVWLINQDIEPQLLTMSLAVGVGGVPVYMPANGAAGSPFATLMGRPVIPIEQASTLGDQGDIMFVNLSQYKGIDKGGIQRATSIHVRFLQDETALRFVYRFDGQPKWDAPMTPAEGANNLSPFVTLDERS